MGYIYVQLTPYLHVYADTIAEGETGADEFVLMDSVAKVSLRIVCGDNYFSSIYYCLYFFSLGFACPLCIFFFLGFACPLWDIHWVCCCCLAFACPMVELM